MTGGARRMVMAETQKNGRCPHLFEIGIIGGTKGMGEWFARFFEKEGYGVQVSGRNKGMGAREMADHCRVVIVSVPMGVTRKVIEEIGPHMCEDALLMDLTSLKQEPVRAMLASSVSDVIGIHPLFGPQVESMAGQRVVLCPARGHRWIPWLRNVLEKNGAHVVETTPETHDRMMAIVQGLNHFNTMAMGVALSESGTTLPDLKRFSTPAFNVKVRLLEKVFCQNPGLYAEILTMNPDIPAWIDRYAKIITEMKDMVLRGDSEDMTEHLESHADYFKKKNPDG
jgi:prephenate dehydrogenase